MKKMLALVLALMLVLTAVPFAANAEEIKDLQCYNLLTNEMNTFCYHYSQSQQSLDVLANCIDNLLTNDAHGNLVPNIAYDWFTEDGGKNWTFKLNEGVTWVDYQGNYKADCTAEDFATGMEWILNYYKNQAANISMPEDMIEGATAYYEYTKALSEEEAKALKLDKFYEMVGVSVPDPYTITYTCVDKLTYFPTLACYNCLAPLSAALIEEIGVDGYFGVTYDTMWYNGPYTITYYVYQNEKVMTKNESYWNLANVKLFDTVTVKMVDSVTTAYQMFQQGELDYVKPSEDIVNVIANNESNEWHDYLVPTLPTQYAYNWKLNYNKLLEDGTPDVNWNTAIANENFRQSLMWGLDLTMYLRRTNALSPLSCQCYILTPPKLVSTSDGVDFSDLVMEKIGLSYDSETYTRYNPEKAAAYKAAAIEELTAQGVTFPIELDWYIKGDNSSAKDSADVMAQMFAEGLGTDYIKFVTKTYVSNLSNEVLTPRVQSIYSSGWGADYADPYNFLVQEICDYDNSYSTNRYTHANDIVDPECKALYDEFTAMVNAGQAITDDIDLRYNTLADAEAFFINHALIIPTYFNKTNQLTCINDYSRINALYGCQSGRYVNWETSTEPYTLEQYAEFAK